MFHTLPVRAMVNTGKPYDIPLQARDYYLMENRSQEDVVKAFQPADDSVTAVRDWISSVLGEKKQITHTDNKAWLAFDASTAELEKLLHTQYYEHHDAAGGRVKVTCVSHYPAPNRDGAAGRNPSNVSTYSHDVIHGHRHDQTTGGTHSGSQRTLESEKSAHLHPGKFPLPLKHRTI